MSDQSKSNVFVCHWFSFLTTLSSLSLLIPVLSVLEPLFGRVDCWTVVDRPWCSHGVCLTHQPGATAIDWSVNRHDHIVLLFRKPVSICRLWPPRHPAAGTRSISASCCLLKGVFAYVCMWERHCSFQLQSFSVCIRVVVQAQLRAFIPEMLKYSTGRGKPGWGKESCKPVWWPEDIPWANVRSDVRTEEQKQRVREINGVMMSYFVTLCREIMFQWLLFLLSLNFKHIP